MATRSQSAPAEAPLITSDLRLDEMTRILDVASELHARQQQVHQQLHLDDVKQDLRERLLAGAKAAGEEVTSEQIDAAIAHYFGELHAYEDPPRSFSTFLAEAYVRFGLWPAYGLLIAVAALAAWSLYLFAK